MISGRCSIGSFRESSRQRAARLRHRGWQHHAEFVAAAAKNQVYFSNAAVEDSRNLHKDFVADNVTVRVINNLEVVQVHHQQRKRSVVTLGSRRFTVQNFMKESGIEDAVSGSSSPNVADRNCTGILNHHRREVRQFHRRCKILLDQHSRCCGHRNERAKNAILAADRRDNH